MLYEKRVAPEMNTSFRWYLVNIARPCNDMPNQMKRNWGLGPNYSIRHTAMHSFLFLLCCFCGISMSYHAPRCRKCGTCFVYVCTRVCNSKQKTTKLIQKEKKKGLTRRSIEAGGSAAAFSEVLLERAEVGVIGAGDGLGVFHVQQRQA